VSEGDVFYRIFSKPAEDKFSCHVTFTEYMHIFLDGNTAELPIRRTPRCDKVQRDSLDDRSLCKDPLNIIAFYTL